MSQQKMAILVKRTLCLFFTFLLVLFFGCARKEQPNSTKKGDISENSESIVTDEKTAKKIADVVLTQTLEKPRAKYKSVEVFFEPRNQSWLVVYSINKNTVGNDISIRISQKDGAILSVEFGE